MSPKRDVIVVGSANVDISVHAPTLPRPGETVFGNGSTIGVGGKGANQAVASACCSAFTRFIARVGADAFGQMVRDGLADHRVNIEDVESIEGAATGLATISVEDSGQNSIVVVPGANELFGPSDLDAVRTLIRDAAVVVAQCEIQMETVYRTVELAAEYGALLILNPAPFRGLDLSRIAGRTTYLIPNATEASQLTGMAVESVEQAMRCADALKARGISCVIITLGAEGCVVVDEQPARHIAAPRVAAIDTTGAGDAFVGCLAASIATDRSRDESIHRAIVYSALSTTRRGAQASYFGSTEFERAWTRRFELQYG